MVLRRADRCDPSTGPASASRSDGAVLWSGGLAGPARMRRRAFINIFGSAVAWPLAARAQQAGKPPTIGFLGSGTPTSQRTWVTAFVERLRELGWIEGRTITIVYRWAEGRPERFVEIAGEFVQRKVDI